MKIPKKEVVKFVVKAVLHRQTADSLAELTDLVNEDLKKVDRQYSISGGRLRSIAVSMPEVKVRVETKKGRTPKRCPACSSALRKVWGRNLKGRKVLENLRCPKCGYKGHDGRWLPRQYGFWIGKESG
jgi:predicted RNA-binding Zn-ribbon protein involved in translation (DUF1610 family)